MRQVRIEFILLQFGALSPATASELIGTIAEAAMKHEAEIEQLLGTVVLIHHGAHEEKMSIDRAAFVAELQTLLPADHRIVHGRAPGTYGDLGSDHKKFYGLTFLGSEYAMARLFELDPGTVEELMP